MYLKELLKHKRYAFFCIGGISVFLIEVIMTIILTEFFHIWHMYSYALSLILGLVILFAYHSFITFENLRNILNNFSRFTAVYFSSYIASWILVLIITHLGLHYIISIIIISISLSIFTYKINKKWVFNNR